MSNFLESDNFLPSSILYNGYHSHRSEIANSFSSSIPSGSSIEEEDHEYPSIERGRGTPFARPLFFSRDEDQAEERPIFQDSVIEKLETPIEILRKIPGCGINPYDVIGDEPIRAETTPIQSKPAQFAHSLVENVFSQFDHDPSVNALFGKDKFIREHFQRKIYGRARAGHINRAPPFRPRMPAPPRLSESEAAILSTQSQQKLLKERQPRDQRFTYTISPLSPFQMSAASRSPSPPSSISSFAPLAASTMLKTPTVKEVSYVRRRPLHRPSYYLAQHPDSEDDVASPAANSHQFQSESGESLPEEPFPRARRSLVWTPPTKAPQNGHVNPE